jgi:ComF family protein
VGKARPTPPVEAAEVIPSYGGTQARRPAPWRLLVEEAWDALLPQRCLVCRRFGAALHSGCVEGLPRAGGARCDRCWAPLRGPECWACTDSPPLVAAKRAAFRFEGPARRAILEAKFRGISSFLPPLARAAAEAVPPRWGIEAVVPVPLHAARRRRRGFNQAEVIARTVASELGVPLEAHRLRRPRRTPPQAGLDAASRALNLEGAFALDGRSSSPARRLLLVDDVTTTGATLEAAARPLLEAGGVRSGTTLVFALALARED